MKIALSLAASLMLIASAVAGDSPPGMNAPLPATYTGDGPNGPVKSQRISAHDATFALVEGGRIRRFVDYYDFASAFAASTDSVK